MLQVERWCSSYSKGNYYLSTGITSYWQSWLSPFTWYFFLLAKVIITIHLVSPFIGKGDYYLSSHISSYWQRYLLPFILYLSPYCQRWLSPFILYLLLLAKVIITFHLVSFTLWGKVIITFHLVSCTLLAKVIITFYLVVLTSQSPSLSRNQPTFLLVNITIRLVPQGQIHVVC